MVMNTGNRSPRNFAEWIGLSRRPVYENALWFGPVFGAILLIMALILIMASLAILFHFLLALFGAEPYESDKTGEAIRNIGLVLVGLFGAPLLVWRSAVVARQTEIAAESLFNDKINAAAAALSARYEVTTLIESSEGTSVVREWKDDLVARVAAIDRLHGLVGEDSEASERVARLLAAYIRGNFQCKNLDPTPEIKKRRTPRMDQQKAIDVIGKILPTAHQSGDATLRLDLTKCDFDGVKFSRGYFRGVDFSESRFEASLFQESIFEGARFVGCLMNNSMFIRCNMIGVRLDFAIWNRPESNVGGMYDGFLGCDLTGVTFVGADVSAIHYLGTVDEVSQTFGTRDTQLHPDLECERISSSTQKRAESYRILAKSRKLSDIEKEKIDELDRSAFKSWSPFPSSDLSSGPRLRALHEKLGLVTWPHSD